MGLPWIYTSSGSIPGLLIIVTAPLQVINGTFVLCWAVGSAPAPGELLVLVLLIEFHLKWESRVCS